MLTFSWTGKRKKKIDDTGHAHKTDAIEHFPNEPSVSRSTTTSDGSINISHNVTFQSSLSAVFREAELSGRLMLKGFRLTDVPNELFDNTEMLDVVLLDISDNDLCQLTDHFGLLDSLISFIARSNRFRDFPTCISYLEQLTYLDLSFNRLASIPDAMFDLPLATLKLAGNRLTGLPEAIRHLSPTLVHLDLSRNELRIIPSHLRHLKHLRVLKLTHNRLEDYPSELCSLSLRTLDLSSNNLGFLPRELSKCKSIESLQLARNPLRAPPLSVVEKGIVHIFKWLETNPAQIARKSISPDKETRKQNVEDVEKSMRIIRTNNNNPAVNGFTTVHKEISERRLPLKSSQTPSPTELCSPNANTVINKEKASSVDEQNNNKVGQKKPISKVAPMIKSNVRTVSASNATSLPQKPSLIRKSAPTSTTKAAPTPLGKKEAVKAPIKGSLAKPRTLVRTEVKTELRATKPLTVSNAITNKAAAPIKLNEIETARKLLREKLGSSFALSRGDMAFSMQLSDGVELCKFVNKLSPEAVRIATTEEMPILTARSRANAERFVQYCKKQGVPETTLCTTTDILGKKNAQKVAKTILCLAKQAPKAIQC